MVEARQSRQISIPEDMRGHYLPGHRFWTGHGEESGQLVLRCLCGFRVEGSGPECIAAGTQHCHQGLTTTRAFRREIILRFGSAIAVWSYDPSPGSWVATASLATAVAEFCQEWARDTINGLVLDDQH